jgi:hypothetical protein
MPTQLLVQGTSFQNELHISQEQLDILDLSFLVEDIPIADGLFHLPRKEKQFAEECHPSDDESTVDLTNSSHSSHSLIDDSMNDEDQESSHFSSSRSS